MMAIAWVNLVRMFRDRSNIFFVVLMPIVLILTLGSAFGTGAGVRLGVSGGEDGPLAGELLYGLSSLDGVEVVHFADTDALRTAVERGSVDAGLSIPAHYDALVRQSAQVSLPYAARNGPSGRQLRVTVDAAVARITTPLRAARHAGGDFTQAVTRARTANMPGITITTPSSSLTPSAPATAGGFGFDTAAISQLLLFVFLTSLTSASELVQTRKLGLTRRIRAAPISTARILAGEGLGRTLIALVQGLIIMLGSALLFGVRWGDPVGAAALLLTYALVGGGAAMLLGSAASSTQQATSLGLLGGLGLAALGGTMVPLDLFPAAMRQVAHLTPHAWAVDGFTTLLRHHGTLLSVLPQLAVLTAFAAAFFTLGAWRLRKTDN
ncbi:MAG: ABC transporter permease [Nonomuraea sp.]|nr:ABC transporter permease [Nonomuraea sp.]